MGNDLKRGYGSFKFLDLVKQSEVAIWKGKTQQIRTVTFLNGFCGSDFCVNSHVVFSSSFNPGSSEWKY